MSVKIITMPDGFSFFIKNEEPEILYTLLSSACVKFILDGFNFYDYGKSLWEHRSISFDNKIYRFFFSDPNYKRVNLTSLRKGNCTLLNEEGNKIDLDVELQSMLISASFSSHKNRITCNDRLIGTLLRYEGNKKAFAIGDLDKRNFKAELDVQIDPLNRCLLKNCIVAFEYDLDEVLCLDLNLDQLWSFKPEESVNTNYMQPLEVYHNLVIQNFGPANVTHDPKYELDGVKHYGSVHYHDDTLYALTQSDGHVVWKTTIPKCVDNMQIIDGKLYLCSANEVHQLNVETGENLKVIDTELSDDFSRSRYKSGLHIQNDKLFFFHPADQCLLIYSLPDFQLLRRINIPSPYTIKTYEYYHKATGKLYFELGPHNGKEYYHMSPILEVDLSDLNTEIEINNGPAVDIQLKPSDETPKQQEIWVSIKDIPLDEALVYGEMHTENQAYYHGFQSAEFHTIHHTENFNGKVHFRYSGSKQPLEEIHKKLAIMTERFKDWASSQAFAPTNRNQTATLDAQYLE